MDDDGENQNSEYIILGYVWCTFTSFNYIQILFFFFFLMTFKKSKASWTLLRWNFTGDRFNLKLGLHVAPRDVDRRWPERDAGDSVYQEASPLAPSCGQRRTDEEHQHWKLWAELPPWYLRIDGKSIRRYRNSINLANQMRSLGQHPIISRAEGDFRSTSWQKMMRHDLMQKHQCWDVIH